MSASIIRMAAPVEIKAAGSKVPTARIVAYTGGAMSVPGFGPVAIDLRGLEITAAVPLLSDHETDIEAIVGSGSARIEAGQLIVMGELTTATAAGSKVVELGKGGFPWQASVGVEPLERERIAAGQTITVNGKQVTAGASGLTLVRKGRLREVSITAIGADAGTSVAIAAHHKGSEKMTTQNIEAALLPENADGLTLPERIEARWGRERWHDAEGLPRQRAQRAMIAASAGRITPEDFENQLLRERLADSEIACIRAQAPKGPAIHSGSRQTTGDVLQAALLCHLGHEATAVKALGEPATQAGRGMRITHAMDLVKACLEASGAPVPAARDDMIRASGFSTVSLPGILGNVANKLLLDAYQAVPSVARIVAKKLTASDFKQHTGYRLSAESKFEEVGAAGELKHGTLGESSFTFQVATFARMFNLTRQSLINDDLGAFEAMPRLCGRGAAVALEEKFWQLVLANTGTFFGTGNKNYLSGAGTALDISSLGAAVTKMRQAVDANGVPVLLTPKYLVIPPELEATADALYASTNVVLSGDTDVVSPDGNPYKGKYQPLVVPHLSNASYSGYSASAWYLFGLPDDVAAFGIAFLNNQESPTIESSDSDFNTLGTQFRGYLDFGVCQIDHRGAVMSAGA